MWLRTRRAASQGRGIAYARLVSALEEPSCPICLLAARAVSRFLDGVSYEQINDPGIRERLCTARGFCNRHAWQFVDQLRDGLGTAILYADILGAVLGPMRAAVPRDRGSLRGRLLGWWPRRAKHRTKDLVHCLIPTGECPACGTLNGTARAYIDTLLDQLAAGTLSDCYRHSSGLCLPHLRIALSQKAGRNVIQLLCDHARLSEKARAYPDRTGSTAWRAVAAHAVGLRGVAPLSSGDVWHVPYGEVPLPIEPNSRPGSASIACPLCQVALDSIDRRLNQLVDELQPSDAAREVVTRALDGTCNEHAWALLERLPPSLALECLEALSGGAIRKLRADRNRLPHPWDARAWAGTWSLGADSIRTRPLARTCGVCAAREDGERAAAAYLAAISTRHPSDVPDPCLPHVVLRLASGKADPDDALLPAMVCSFTALRRELDNYIRRQDYHFAGKPLGQPGAVPWRAVERLAGVRGLSGEVVASPFRLKPESGGDVAQW
jgi:hypothetical protein